MKPDDLRVVLGGVWDPMKSGTTRGKPSEFVTFAAAVLRGDDPRWPKHWMGEQENDFLDRARRNGVEALLFDRLQSHPRWSSWPESVRETLRTNTQLDAAVEIIRKIELDRVLSTFGDVGLRPLLFKGTPLAYSLYTAPHLRPRVDTDLLLPQHRIDQAHDLMRALGYERELAIPGDTILSQLILTQTDERGLSHTFDIHWKISNPHAFADILTYEELMEGCAPVPKIGATAVAPSATHSLLIACIHRAAHHLASNRLIWLYDMHLLIERMDEDEIARFVELSCEKQVASVCLDALEASQAYFATTLPAGFFEEFRSTVAAGERETTSAYVTGTRSRLNLLWRDLRSQSGLGAALRSLKQHAIPPPSYILRRYDTDNKTLLPYLYTRRFVEGVPKLFKRLG